MSVVRFCCPKCRQATDNPRPGAIVSCPCGQKFQVPATPVILANHVASGVLPHTQKPRRVIFWGRIALAGGILAAFFGCMGLAALMTVHNNASAKNEADSGNLAEGDETDPFDGSTPQGEEKADEQLQPDVPSGPDQGPAQEPLRKAFNALGARSKLDAIKAVQINGKAHFNVSPNVNAIKLTWQSTRQFKYVETNKTLSLEIGFVLKGDQGWNWFGKAAKTMDKSMVADQQLFAYSLSLSNLLPLKEKGYDLIRGDNLNIAGRDCYSINVKSSGRPDMLLYFDNQTNLLSKSAFRGKLFMAGTNLSQSIAFECFYGNYKKVNGVNHWWKFEQFRDGSRYAELNLDSIRFFDKIDGGLFSVPHL
jgi:hypothetical protein